ncbi:hypothetical protein QJQ45_014950 [Haematococcus lacustris]|nr:hypothetical protein QJQ45_014950 [Haematococcus lacustris]
MAGQDGDGGKPSSLEWQHVTSTKLLHGHSISCNYCHAKFSGGATRIRDHMCRCAAAPNAVKLLFGTRIVDAKEKATAAKAKRTLNFNTGGTGARCPTVSPAKLPISPAATASSTAAVVRELDVAFGWLVYANGLPFDTPRKPEMAEIIRLARKLPPHTRYSPPTRKTLAGPMLIRAKDTLTKALEPFQQQFQRSGVSLVTDGYKDINGHHISNYLLVCALGAYFHSSVNSTVGPDTTVRVDAIYTAQRMHRVVQAVGVHMFVAIVTDSAAVMPAAGWQPAAQDMSTVVAIHNSVNERAWAEVKAWEALHCADCPQGPRLVRFQGRPADLSPKARLLNALGYALPFDRHDWVVDRCGHQVRYVIDFYAGVPQPGGPPAAMFLDTRPALDSFGAAWDRIVMQARWMTRGMWQ